MKPSKSILSQSESSINYIIDASDRLISVNDAWLSFTCNNDGGLLTREAVLNQSLWDFIVNEEAVNLYIIILEKVRAGKVIRFKFRCDSPQSRRFMEMEISLLGNAFVQFKSQVMREESREVVNLLDVKASRTQEFLTICSWCNRLKTLDERWIEIEEIIVERELFYKDEVPKLTHGICIDCYENVVRSID
jgi:hypothetical protein